MDTEEKSFYLRAFRGFTLAFVLSDESDLDPEALSGLAGVLAELIQHDSKALLLHQASPPTLAALDRLRERLGETASGPLAACHYPGLPAGLTARQWRPDRALVSVELGGEGAEGAMETFSRDLLRLGLALRMSRLVVLEAQGGISGADGPVLSFVNLMEMGRLAAVAPVSVSRRQRLLLFKSLLTGGVGAISLCRMRDIPRELFTYAGCGSFFARRHHCQVRLLGLDDFARVGAMIRQAEAEGTLLPRSDQALSSVLAAGYGGFVSNDHLAGFCALITEPYADERGGEVVSLHAVTRFQGSGVGGRLIRHMQGLARRKKLAFLFACSTRERAVALFERHGFVRVGPERVPGVKWQGYDPRRKGEVICVRWSPEGTHV